MFPLLSAYLYQEKKLTVPGIGLFQLIPVHAATGFETVEAPGWEIRFTENREASSNENPDALYAFLAGKEQMSTVEALEQFEEFARNVLVRLNDQETVVWEDVGTLEKPDFRIAFIPQAVTLSPFTGIAAQKVIREHANVPLRVGEKETSSEAIKEAQQKEQAEQSRSRKITWMVLAAAVVIAAAFLLKNGCSLQSAGNQQKASIQKTEATYQQN
ncbi:hypothetical protein LQ567_11590 [Niabella pedocola]|uniref:CCDC81-like prokaryotic HU domain-containing protein n=1 Tax=Niabella pedocola TaxID=1752077 RepID=A0ABS8PSW6_9BACT|nr:hypothetical protein [Niabella pedocola]MCD2423407.1 hypothetical protein [Niabella pedocola]